LGFQDIVSSVESGDTIKLLMSRFTKNIKKEETTYVKNLQVDIELVKRYDDIKKTVASQDKSKAKKINELPEVTEIGNQAVVIKPDGDIPELLEKAPKTLYPLLNYVQNSKIETDDHLMFYESFFALSNKS
jgi:hypothetical protein